MGSHSKELLRANLLLKKIKLETQGMRPRKASGHAFKRIQTDKHISEELKVLIWDAYQYGGENAVPESRINWERVVGMVVGVGIVVFMMVLVIRDKPFENPTTEQIVITLLSLGAAVVGATIPGLLGITIRGGRAFAIRATGALALFVLTFLFTPGMFGGAKGAQGSESDDSVVKEADPGGRVD